MINAVLHKLTNRADSFGHHMYPNASTYVPHTESEDESKLRDFLKLRSTDELYYLQGVSTAVYSFPEILIEFGESSRSYDFQDYSIANFTVSGGVLESKFGKSSKVEYFPSEFPISGTTEIKFLSNTDVLISRGTSRVECAYNLRTGGYLDIEWPEGWGIQGILGTDGNDWTEFSEIVINHEPHSFPYTELGKSMDENQEMYHILNGVGLIAQFHSAQSGLEKVALACLALCRSYKYEQ